MYSLKISIANVPYKSKRKRTHIDPPDLDCTSLVNANFFVLFPGTVLAQWHDVNVIKLHGLAGRFATKPFPSMISFCYNWKSIRVTSIALIAEDIEDIT